MTHTDKRLVVTMMTNERLVLDIAELPIPNSINLDNLVIETRIVNDTPPRLKRDRSPLHPDALVLADLKVGKKIRVCGKLGITKYTGIIAGEPFSDDIGYKTPIVVIEQGPFGYEGIGYHEMYAADMGLVKHRASGQWNPTWYTVAAR